MSEHQTNNGNTHKTDSESVTIFIDYSCPFAYRAIEWMQTLVEQSEKPPQIDWRYFSLAQVNYKARDGWKVWDAPGLDPNWGDQQYARGLRFFWASAAANEQGEEAVARFRLALARAIHVDKAEFPSFEPILEVAQGVGLNMDRFIADIANRDLLSQLAEDHTAGAELEVFGVPTFRFGNAEPAYLKLKRVLEPGEAVTFWETYRHVVADLAYVAEIKRPQ